MNVYFVQAGGDKGPVKIGISGNVASRLSGIQSGNAEPCRILASFEHSNAAAIERQLHVEFADLRLKGEWFTFDERITTLISAWQAIEHDQGRLHGSFSAVLLNRVRESKCRTLIADWWVVTWNEEHNETHTMPLLEHLSLTHDALLFNRTDFRADVIVAIVETDNEADRLQLAFEPWLQAMKIARRIGLGNGWAWWREPGARP